MCVSNERPLAIKTPRLDLRVGARIAGSLTIFDRRRHPNRAAKSASAAEIVPEQKNFSAAPVHRRRLQRFYPSHLPLSAGGGGLIALETSGPSGSVAWFPAEPAADRPAGWIPLDPQQRSAVTLAAALHELIEDMREHGQRPDWVAVANGPGSFTGLRIGVTTAKTLAYALGCRCLAVDTLAAMAWRFFRQPSADQTLVGINAYRGQVFAARWTRQRLSTAARSATWASATEIWPAARWREEAANAPACAADVSLCRQSPAAVELAPTAIDVGDLARIAARSGHHCSPLELLPNYFRHSAAEENLG